MSNSRRSSRNTITFLRMAAVQLRTLVERAPGIAAELQHMANQFDAEAKELEDAGN